MTLTYGSLFSGIGGIDLGLDRAGMECKWQVEIDDYATRVLEKHWPDVPRYRDVRDVGADNLVPVDLICGGFPCQDISNAGGRIGITGERSGLWSEYARVVGELRPSYVLVENVAALLGRGIDTVLGDLATLGFDAEWECLPAAAFGAPHIRDRVFILAYPQRNESQCDRRLGGMVNAASSNQGRKEERQRIRDATRDSSADVADPDSLGGYRRASITQQRRAVARVGSEDVAHANVVTLEGGRTTRVILPSEEIGKGSLRRFRERDGAEQWRTEPDVGRVVDGPTSRLERSIRIAQVQCLGNAVVPQITEWIGRRIVEEAHETRAMKEMCI